MNGLFNSPYKIADKYENLPYPKTRFRDFAIRHAGKVLTVIGVFLIILGL